MIQPVNPTKHGKNPVPKTPRPTERPKAQPYEIEFEIEFKLSDLPAWKPHIVIDVYRLEGEDD